MRGFYLKNIGGKTKEYVWEGLFLLIVFGAEMSLAAVQMFGHPPDEFARFEVVYFIFRHGYLPTGYEIEVQIGGYGGSYAFQPILTYIIQGYLMRFLNLFTGNIYILVLAARMVNCVFGVIMAHYVRKISVLLWDSRMLQWLFTCLVVFLPENIFIHSYINTDSMAAMGISVIIYAVLMGEKDDYGKKTAVTLSAGVSLVALSYYNAYAAILTALLAFIAHFARSGEYRKMWRKMGFIILLVSVMSGWWFIRSGILYNGDILGLHARSLATLTQAEAAYNPLTKKTFANTGRSVMDLLRSEYHTYVYHSFICTMGAMDLPTKLVFYQIDKVLLALAAVLCIVPVKSSVVFWKDGRQKRTIELLFAMDMIITASLHLLYSYAYDYQPQGRYLLPMLIPLMYFMTVGADKGGSLILRVLRGRYARVGTAAVNAARSAIVIYILFSLFYAIMFCVLPYYRDTMQEMKYISAVTFMQYLPQPMKY
jgi:hypothetical protein